MKKSCKKFGLIYWIFCHLFLKLKKYQLQQFQKAAKYIGRSLVELKAQK